MHELDALKERIGYLKVWLGLLVLAAVSTAGWLATGSAGASGGLKGLAIATWVATVSGIVWVNFLIEACIERIRRL